MCGTASAVGLKCGVRDGPDGGFCGDSRTGGHGPTPLVQNSDLHGNSQFPYRFTIHELLCTTVIRAQGTAPPVLPPPRRRLWPYIAKGFDEHLLPLVML